MAEESKSQSAPATLGCAVIVGVGPGMGRSFAIRFAKGGYNVALVSRNPDKTKSIEEEINAKCPSVKTLRVAADTSNAEQCKKALTEITADAAKLGRVEVLVFNAAGSLQFPFPSFLDLELKQLEQAFDVGAKGFFIWAQLVLPDMIKNENKTSLLVTGATASLRGGAKLGHFASIKFALRALAQSLAREFGPQGVHVAHFVLDGLIMGDPQKIDSNDNGTKINPNDVADTYFFVHQQPKSAWVQELDLRPNVEKF